jgi:archaellum component FlaC
LWNFDENYHQHMKAEDRIIELLAEYLKKADQMQDNMERTDNSIKIMSRAIAEHSIKFNTITEEIRQMREDQTREMKQIREDQTREMKQIREDQTREIKQLRDDQTGEMKQLHDDQGVMLRELVSLSKRVAVVEEKN